MSADERPDITALHQLAEHFTDDPRVQLGSMFRSPGLRVDAKIFAFLGHENRLIVKVPRDRALELLATGSVTTVTMGERTMREWVAVPLGADAAAAADLWYRLAREAYEYVSEA